MWEEVLGSALFTRTGPGGRPPALCLVPSRSQGGRAAGTGSCQARTAVGRGKVVGIRQAGLWGHLGPVSRGVPVLLWSWSPDSLKLGAGLGCTEQGLREAHLPHL